MEEILELLDNGVGGDESDDSNHLRNQATQILTRSKKNTSVDLLNSSLHDLLSTVLKPLFSKSHHPSLTSTGRRNLVSTPKFATRFGSDSIFDPPPLWKATHWTVPLLTWILEQYTANVVTLPPQQQQQQKKSIESDFHLLVPPILHLLDDHDLTYKVQGCTCLGLLCATITATKSEIMKRTGLAEVFLEALRGCFHYLPSLTPEDESFALLSAMYPAYLAVVRARFIDLKRFTRPDDDTNSEIDKHNNKSDDDENDTITITVPSSSRNLRPPPPPPPTPSTPTPTPAQISNEITLKTTHLTTLLHSSLLYSLSHLSTSPSSISTTSPTLTTYLLTQITPIFEALEIYATTHLQTVLPILIGTLKDPFVTAAPKLVEAAVDAVEGVVRCCWVRVRERWWVEVLSGVVVAWLNCKDDLSGKVGTEELKRVMGRLERVVEVLDGVVGEELGSAVEKLVEEEEEVVPLFAAVRKESGRDD